MNDKLREPLRFLWQTLDRFFANSCPTMAAALSFYTFFSLPALLALLLLLVGTVADAETVHRAILVQVGSLIGRAGAEQVETVIGHAQRTASETSTTAFWSGLAVLLGATTAFAQLQNSLNRAWGVKPDPRRGPFRNFLAKRVFSFGVVLAVAFMLLVSLGLTAVVTTVGGALGGRVGVPDELLAVFDTVISFVIVAALFAAMFKLLPDAKISWRDVGFGAVATAVLFVIGKWAIGLYLGGSDPGSAYGAAGSLAVVLIWVYYTSMVVLFGAELTRVWAERYGRGVRPEKGAVAFVEQEHRVETG